LAGLAARERICRANVKAQAGSDPRGRGAFLRLWYCARFGGRRSLCQFARQRRM